jgi:hypothetical protein
MKDLTARFSEPINIGRPRAGRLIEGLSPKLARRVRLFDHATFAAWIALEADPTVITFCEHPARIGANETDPPIDFWVRRANGEEFILVAAGATPASPIESIGDIKVRYVADAELAAANTWILNWKRMLPVINATRPAITRALTTSVRKLVVGPSPLAEIEQHLSVGDPTLVRGAIFDMLRTAQLAAPTLHDSPLSLHTIVEPMQ